MTKRVKLTIKRDGEKLVANIPNEPKPEFFALNENTFFIRVNSYNPTTWIFTRDADGNISQVVIHTLVTRIDPQKIN